VSTVLQKYFRPRPDLDPAVRTQSFGASRLQERAGFRIAAATQSKMPRLMLFFCGIAFASPRAR
jgi:hypothetical protein